jgi:hypothetical protein
MVTYYVKVSEVYKVSATQKCEVKDANGEVITTCEACSIASFNAPTSKITLSDDNAVLDCLSEVSGDLSLLTQHTHNSAIHNTVAEKDEWREAAINASDAKTQLNAHIGQTGIHVTESEKLSWTTSASDVSTMKTQISGFAPLNSPTLNNPTFTGTPTAPTASNGTSNNQVATTLYVNNVIASKQNKSIGTANRVLVSDANGDISVSSSITSTELGYLNNVTSNIQTQLNSISSNTQTKIDDAVSNLQTLIDAKQASITGASSTITSSNLTASRALVSNSNGKVAVSAVTSTELGYLDGVTSNIQSQLDAKQDSISGAATTITSSNLTASRVLVSNSSGKVSASPITATELGYVDGVTSNIQTQLNNRQKFLNYSATSYFPSTVSSWYSVSGVTSEAQRKVKVAKDSIVILQARPYVDANAPTTTNKVLFDIYVDGTCVIKGLSVTGGGSSSYQFPLKANQTLMWKLQDTDNTIRLDCNAIIIPFED